VLDFRSQRPLEATLRNTIGSPERIEQLQSRTKLDGFLRNTSYFSMNASQKNEVSSRVIPSGESSLQMSQSKQRISSKMEVERAKEGNKTFENAETNYNKIMEKLDKK
jgi:ketol-acid reductoisomerase